MDRRTLTGSLYLLGAIGVLAALWLSREPPSLVLLVVFAIPYVWLEIHAVEVHDRLRISSSIMVLLSAGVVFGPDSRALGMAILTGFWPFVPADFKERRVFFPVVSFGQLVMSAAAAGFVLDVMAPAVIDDGAALLRTAGAALVAAGLYAALNMLHIEVIRRLVLTSGGTAGWFEVGTLLLSFTAVGAIGGMLGATLAFIGTIVLLPVFFVVYLIGQLAFQSYADLRQAQESTIQGFIKALEAKDMFVHGHTARVASFAQMIGRQLNLGAQRMDRLRWAALLHDVGAVGVPRDLLRNRRSLSEGEQAELLADMQAVEHELYQSDFLRPMMERAARLRLRFSEAPPDEITADAQILAVAKWFDSVTNPRVREQAFTQERSLAQLEAESPSRYDPEVVAAFAAALKSSGFEYGAPAGEEPGVEPGLRRRVDDLVPEETDEN